ncbi:MAG: TIGR00269 family protein [Candidatus Aenigmarchaeota archaeon]|nr:TIGR00269 family protein [Candidatus Aenigmarchaeota archaeon]
MQKCTRCGKKAVIHRKYEGSYLCSSHFIKAIESKAKRTIRQSGMVDRGDKIAFALSGGKDSSAVMYLINKVFANRDDLSFVAFTIDEGIPGYRDESIEIAKKLCSKLGIEHHIFSFKDEFGMTLDEKVKESKKSKKWEGTACTYCGLARRWMMNKKSRELGATKVCVGMNLDDEIQGIMMDYLKGDISRLSRMTGEPLSKNKLFVSRIKPFRDIPEKEVGLYAILVGLDVQEDECPNLEGPRFRVRDFLNEFEANSPGIKFSTANTFKRLAPAIREVAKKEGTKLIKCTKCGEPSSQKVCKTCELWKQ